MTPAQDLARLGLVAGDDRDRIAAIAAAADERADAEAERRIPYEHDRATFERIMPRHITATWGAFALAVLDGDEGLAAELADCLEHWRRESRGGEWANGRVRFFLAAQRPEPGLERARFTQWARGF